jgi:hypothetical protein
MRAAKDHLRAILEGLAEETGVGAFRVAFVGYRDFRDPDRVVRHPFVAADAAGVAAVAAAIEAEAASGGAGSKHGTIRR